MPKKTQDEAVPVCFRITKKALLERARDALPYRASLSSLIDRGIDLLVADMKARGEWK